MAQLPYATTPMVLGTHIKNVNPPSVDLQLLAHRRTSTACEVQQSPPLLVHLLAQYDVLHFLQPVLHPPALRRLCPDSK